MKYREEVVSIEDAEASEVDLEAEVAEVVPKLKRVAFTISEKANNLKLAWEGEAQTKEVLGDHLEVA